VILLPQFGLRLRVNTEKMISACSSRTRTDYIYINLHKTLLEHSSSNLFVNYRNIFITYQKFLGTPFAPFHGTTFQIIEIIQSMSNELSKQY